MPRHSALPSFIARLARRATAAAAPLARFAADRRAVAAIELALIAPVLIGLLLAGLDTSRYLQAARKVTQIANTVTTITSQNNTGTLTPTNLRFYSDSAMVIFPDLLSNAKSEGRIWTDDIDVTISSIRIAKILNTPQAFVVWTSGDALRPCLLPLTRAQDTDTPSSTTLPGSIIDSGVSSVIVADITYRFAPMIGGSLLGTVPITRSIFLSPRYVSEIKLDLGSRMTVSSNQLFPGSEPARICLLV